MPNHHIRINTSYIDKPHPKPEPSQAKPSQAKTWAEVVYIITKCPFLTLSCTCAGDSLMSHLLMNRIKPYFQDNVGPTQGQSWWQKNLRPLSQNPIFGQKRGVNHKKSTKLLSWPQVAAIATRTSKSPFADRPCTLNSEAKIYKKSNKIGPTSNPKGKHFLY